jgi:hypothetical protein
MRLGGRNDLADAFAFNDENDVVAEIIAGRVKQMSGLDVTHLRRGRRFGLTIRGSVAQGQRAHDSGGAYKSRMETRQVGLQR